MPLAVSPLSMMLSARMRKRARLLRRLARHVNRPFSPTCLHNSLLVIEPPRHALTAEEQQEKVKSLVAVAQAERKALQVRRALVARRRELLSELTVRKEKEETSRRAEIARREKEEDERRLREEARKKERERTQREIESIRAEEAKKLRWRWWNVVAQIEKEKKEMTERLRVVSKRLDHIERAYRKDERPLLDRDYEEQQNNDRETFTSVQKSVKEAAKHTHDENLETKGRLSRMLADYKARKEVLVAKKGQEYAKMVEAAARKIKEEKSKRKRTLQLQWEEEEKKQAEEERIRREEEEEQARLEAGRSSSSCEAEAKKREEEERHAAIRKAREEERAKADEQARLQRQREEEAEPAEPLVLRKRPLRLSRPSGNLYSRLPGRTAKRTRVCGEDLPPVPILRLSRLHAPRLSLPPDRRALRVVRLPSSGISQVPYVRRGRRQAAAPRRRFLEALLLYLGVHALLPCSG
ncbi:eukaryotic translation initiation factor [Salix suchowensis]|nr:eukaryotic translation initiation factor [Salix suchowensis]